MLDIAIIGGGLSGLALAKQLHQQSRHFVIFEARKRLGGRILSHSTPVQSGSSSPYQTDLGPCWIWPDDQPRIAKLISESQLAITPQWIEGKSLYQAERDTKPQTFIDHSTYGSAKRLSAGSYHLIETLQQQLPEHCCRLNHTLLRLTDRHDHIELVFKIDDQQTVIKARQVVLTLPPRLLVNTLEFSPALSSKLTEVMQGISTWMAGHAKAVIYYKTPFWREAGYSGSAFSAYQGAALGEIFDASSIDGELSALSGFFALPPPLRRDYADDLPALIIEQLVRLFGEQAASPESVIIQDWFKENFTATPDDETSPLFHPNYGHPVLQLDHWNDKLFFCGTETAKEFGGYLEGALASAERVAKALMLSELLAL